MGLAVTFVALNNKNQRLKNNNADNCTQIGFQNASKTSKGVYLQSAEDSDSKSERRRRKRLNRNFIKIKKVKQIHSGGRYIHYTRTRFVK